MAEGAAGRRRVAFRLALVVLVLVALILGGRQLAGLLPAFVTRVAAMGPLAPVVFVLGYAVAAVAFVPGSLLTLAAGAAFGLLKGVPIVFTGATLGASLAFLIARYVARNRVARMVARNPKFAAIDAAIGRDARRIVFLLRLSPVFPFNLLNYALGLTAVRFVDYLVASLGMLPGTVLYVYYGKVAGDVVAVASGSAPARGTGHYAVLALGLAATLLVTILITRNARRALQESVP